MENASKALVMAGSVLIALMIIGALLLMVNNLSSYQETNTVSTREAQVIDFNNQYETYNRKNVRGSDLYSLLNRAVDYNRRKSTTGTGKDEGQYLAFEPMIITFDLTPGGGKEKFYATTNPSESYPNLIQSDSYTVDAIENKFEKDISGIVANLEKTYGADSLSNLVTGRTKIFIDDSSSEEKKQVAVDTFNIASKNKKADNFLQLRINSSTNYRKNVYTYVEYIQFKRAKFDCDKVEYDPKTGRIIKMEFNFTGNFE